MQQPSFHAYAKVSLLSLLMAWCVHHTPEITVICTMIGGAAGLVSLVKGLRGK